MKPAPLLLAITLDCAPPAAPPDASTATAPARPTPYADPAPAPRRYLGRANVEMYSLPVDPPCLRMPLGGPDGEGTRVAQIYQSERHHLGEDVVPADGPARGAPVYAVGNGTVIDAFDHGAGVERGCWGRVVRIVHRLADGQEDLTWYESLYAHLQTMEVELGERVQAGQIIGTVADAGCGGAHLHWEVRDRMNLPLGHGYGWDTAGYVRPSAWVRARRCEAPTR